MHAILDAIEGDLDERGLVDRVGKSRSILNHRARISRQLDNWLAKTSPAIDRQTADDHKGGQIGRWIRKSALPLHRAQSRLPRDLPDVVEHAARPL
jgi:hypothetical protein